MATSTEISVYSLSAQVYALDKSQKWTPLTQDIVTVQFLWNESAQTTRLFAKDDRGVVVNSTILPNMQYRRPSETFVQWFDTQHILYGLNLTSAADADGFEREFDIATGKRPRAKKGSQKDLSAVNTPQMQPKVDKSRSNDNLQLLQQQAELNIAKLSMNEKPSASGDAKLIAQLKARVKELELVNVQLEGDKSSLNETIASQTKTISGLNNQVKQLEADVDKLKAAFQQNAANVAIWKQQLQTYQEVNDQLSTKMTDLAELYDKFGEILKRG